MISAITNRGALAFMVFQGKLEAKGFVEFIKQLLKQGLGQAVSDCGRPSGASLEACQGLCGCQREAIAPDHLARLLPGAQPR
jgi:hypothetical protein